MDDHHNNYINLTNITEKWQPDHFNYSWYIIMTHVLQGIGAVTGLLVNAFLLVLFHAPPRLITLPNKYLLQRAIADVTLLIPYLAIIICIIQDIDHHQTSPPMCRLLTISLHVGEVASHAFLMAFTLDSYLAAYPHHHTLSSRRKTMIVTSTLAWVYAAATGVAAYFLAYSDYNERCVYGPLFDNTEINIVVNLFVLLVLPLVVVWVFVSVALPPRSSETSDQPMEGGKGGPNRRLLLGLASNVTVLQGIVWIVFIINRLLYVPYVITSILYSLRSFDRAINAMLVICLSEELRQKVAQWLPSRRVASVPLQDL